MSAKANYFKLGLFMLVGIALILSTVVILSAGIFEEDPVYMETYFDGSVQGLSAGATVNFRGVPIGRIKTISFVTVDYGFKYGTEEFSKYDKLIRVVMVGTHLREGISKKDLQARRKQMVADGLRVRLVSQPLTGVAYLQADYLDPEHYPVVKIGWQPKYLYIPSAPSAMSVLMKSAERTFQSIAKVDFKRLGELADDLLVSLNQAIADAKIGKISEEGRDLHKELRVSNNRLQVLLRRTDTAKAEATVEEILANINKVVKRIDLLIKRSGPELEQTVSKVRTLLQDLKELTQDLKQNPSQLFMGAPPARSEVIK